MTALILATLSASVLYFAIAFVATVHDRIAARFTPVAHIADVTVTDYATIPEPVAAATFQVIRPALATQSSRLYRCLGIRPLRNEIKRLELAAKCQEINGKSWSRCSKDQLIATLGYI